MMTFVAAPMAGARTKKHSSRSRSRSHGHSRSRSRSHGRTRSHERTHSHGRTRSHGRTHSRTRARSHGGSHASHPAPASAQEGELRKKQEAKRREAAQVRAKVAQLKKKQEKVTVQLEDSQQKVERTTKELKRVNQDLRGTLRSLGDTRKKLTELKSRLNQHLDELTDLLVAYYKNGRTGYQQVLLTSNSFGEFMNRSDAVKRIVESDNELLTTVETEQRLVKQREEELEHYKSQAEKLRGKVAEKREEYRDAAHGQRQLLNRISRERAAYEQYLQELEESSREIERMIRRLNAERKRRKPSGNGSTPDTLWTGVFIRPVPGGMRSPFGYRTHPIFHIRKLHTGVDLGSSYGTPIKAAGGGIVIFSGWKRGYGKTIVIDHGGDTATLYGHCSELLVSAGASVHQGQVIAKVGSTGYSTGPHLHWEVRKNGTPVNPLAL